MKTPLGTEVDLGPGHIVLDWVPALRERGTAAPLFSAHVYCGHGRPSQLLLSSCLTKVMHIQKLRSVDRQDLILSIEFCKAAPFEILNKPLTSVRPQREECYY